MWGRSERINWADMEEEQFGGGEICMDLGGSVRMAPGSGDEQGDETEENSATGIRKAGGCRGGARPSRWQAGHQEREEQNRDLI